MPRTIYQDMPDTFNKKSVEKICEIQVPKTYLCQVRISGQCLAQVIQLSECLKVF